MSEATTRSTPPRWRFWVTSIVRDFAPPLHGFGRHDAGRGDCLCRWCTVARAVTLDADHYWAESMTHARDSLQAAMARNKKYGVETDEGIYEAESELRGFLEQFDGSKGERDEI